MTQEKLEEKLKKLIFEKDKPFVVSISGEWGVGKTYFLQKFFIEKYKEELAKKQIAYISLFGQESLNEIKTNIVLQISKPQKLLNSFKEKIKNIKMIITKKQMN
jgi:predicted AAA+ superfamily ATPase